MHVLRRFPFRDTAVTVIVGEEAVLVRPYQVIVWVSLAAEDTLHADAALFPAVLDTGHGHNFSIQERQLTDWASCPLQTLPKLGAVLINRQEIPLVAAHLWIHRNRPSTSELLQSPFKLNFAEGISVYPVLATNAPRLPLLGLRGLVRNNLRLTIDGMVVSLRTDPESQSRRGEA